MDQREPAPAIEAAAEQLKGLRRHQRRLLFGGGGLLTLIIVFTALFSLFSTFKNF